MTYPPEQQQGPISILSFSNRLHVTRDPVWKLWGDGYGQLGQNDDVQSVKQGNLFFPKKSIPFRPMQRNCD